MNRRMIVVGIAVGALALFAGAALYQITRSDAPVVSESPVLETLNAPAQPAPADVVDAPQALEAASPTDATVAEPPARPAARWTTYVRQHSPVIGPVDAPVTIVEFLDPACEGCRAMYPVVHEILSRHPQDVRLVIRYTPLHRGSEEAVRILETARMQNKFEPVLSALFQQQPRWADHGNPDASLAWQAAGAAGLDVSAGRAAMNADHINAAINQDIADARTLGVRGTPTFFVNEQPLAEFGPQQLYDLVQSEIAAARRTR